MEIIEHVEDVNLFIKKSSKFLKKNGLMFVGTLNKTLESYIFAIVGAGVCYHRLQKNAKATEDVEYPAYGVTGPGKELSPTGGDRKLAQNAQMYHYQHQKQQMIAFDRCVIYLLLLPTIISSVLCLYTSR